MSEIVRWYKTKNGDDPDAQQLLRRIRRCGYLELTALRWERVLRAEGAHAIALEGLLKYFCHPVTEKATPASVLDSSSGPIREVCYRRGMTEPQLETILYCAEALGITGLDYARHSNRYQLCGVSDAVADEITRRFLCNGTTQLVMVPGREWDTLIPQGQVGSVEEFDVANMSDDELMALSKSRRWLMSLRQLQAFRHFFTHTEPRLARDGEAEVYAGLNSNHCAHTTWKKLGLMRKLRAATRRINNPGVISAFVDNSGVWRFYGGWAICIKGETHIYPVFFGDPYGGTMTEFGGILRDIFCTGQGARPILLSTILATCDPRLPWEVVPVGFTHPLIVLLENIRGTKDWGNPSGIPMGSSTYLVHPRNWKGVALGQAIGILRADRARKGHPRPGDFTVLAGDLTGNDGIHGATVSSGANTAETVIVDAASVQIGEPIGQQALMEVATVLAEQGCIRAVNDCGAVGIASSAFEMGKRGVWLNLAWVPLKCKDMTPAHILVSESQQRVVCCIPPEKLSQALAILKAYGVRATVIGVFTDIKRCQAVFDPNLDPMTWRAAPTNIMSGAIVVDLPYSFLDKPPLPDVSVRKPQQKPQAFIPPVPRTETEWVELVKRNLAHFNNADQSAAARQFDGTVGGACRLHYIGGSHQNMPDELSARTPVLGKPWTVGAAVSVNQLGSEVEPAGIAHLLVAQAGAKLVAAGFSPRYIYLCANVMSPEILDSPENAWRLLQLTERGYFPASVITSWPVISGKESGGCTCYGPDGKRYDAPITLSIYATGKMSDYHRLIGKPFVRSGDTIVLYHPGFRTFDLGGSILLDTFGERGETLPLLNLKVFRQGMRRYYRMLQQCNFRPGGPHVRSRSVVAEGGVIRRLFEKSLGSTGLGCRIELTDSHAEYLFSELHGAILFTVSSNEVPEWAGILKDEYTVLGQVTSEPVIDVCCQGRRLFAAHVEDLARGWSKTFSEVVS